MKERILVTGAAGFIGSNLTDNLLDEGFRVIGIDNFDPFYDRKIKERNISEALRNPEFRFIEGDIRDSGFLEKCFIDFKPDIAVHLAAKAGVRPSLLDPKSYYEVNVLGTLNLLEAMRVSHTTRLVFASSSSVYGNNRKVPFSETDNVDYPISPYAASKKAGELLCSTYYHLYGINISCLRFFTVYGPRQRPDLAIYKFTKALFSDQEIPFYGDGTTSRDYTHITDILNGIRGAMNNLSGFGLFNLGESRITSLTDLVRLLENNTGKKAILRNLPLQDGDVTTTFADITRARTLIGYNPVISLEDGIADFVKWFRTGQPG